MTSYLETFGVDGVHWTVEINRSDIRQSRVVVDPPGCLVRGEILVVVERLAISANNITYAQLGDSFGYWDLFPATRPWGRIPAWGYGHVGESMNEDVPVGTRLYGLFPMTSQLIIRAQANGLAIVDASEHRASIDPVYNRYVIDGTSSEDEMNSYALLRPLIVMSFVLVEYLREKRFFGASTVVVTSASSKTALGLGFLLGNEVETIGITSPKNLGFVAASNCFDRTAVYHDELGDVLNGDCLILDFAGNDRITDRLRSSAPVSCRVLRTGQTHQHAVGGEAVRRDASDTFFAPKHIQRLTKAWGRTLFDERLQSAIKGFESASRPWYRKTYLIGPDALLEAATDLASGRVDPSFFMIARPNG